MNHKPRLFTLALLVATIFSGCKTIEPEVTVATGTIDYFTEAMDFPASGGTKVVNFTSNVNWTLKVADTQGSVNWCTMSQAEGSAGTYSVVITVAQNTGYDDRNIVLILTADSIKKNVIINQKQKDAITLTTDRFELGPEGGAINVEVKSNIDYEVKVPEEYQGWIRQSSSTRSLSSNNLTFIVAESTEYDKRSGEIIITSGNLSETVKIYQAGSAIMILSPNEYTIGSNGGSVSIDISCNFEYVVDNPAVDWISPASETRALSSHTLIYDVSPNATYDNREAVIVFKDANGDKKESVKIIQKQKDAILLSSRKVEIPQEGGTFSVEVNSNVDYDIDIPQLDRFWINVSDESSSASVRSLDKTTPRFKVATNEVYDKRESEISFRYDNIVETLTVYQSGGAILVLSQSEYNLEGDATTIAVELKSNIEYSVSISAGWISEVSTRAVSSSTKYFDITVNNTGESRSGQITFTTSDGSKSETVNITQASIVKAESLSISFTNTSGTIGGYLYIGKNYRFSVAAIPENASTDYEWKVEDTSIATISGNGSGAVLSTKDYGKSKVIVTDKNSGNSASYDFGTSVTDFYFTENTGETAYGCPMITMAVGEKHQLQYAYKPSYATRIFSDLRAFNFREILPSINTYAIVKESTIVDIDENGLMTAKKAGTTLIGSNGGYGVCGSYDEIYVKVVSEYTESEYNDDFFFADTIKPGAKIKFYLSSSSDIDVFKFTRPSMYFDIKLTYEGDWDGTTTGERVLSYTLYNSNYSEFGISNLPFPAGGGDNSSQSRWIDTEQGYLRFYVKDIHKQYRTPTGYFTLEIVAKE